jgi:hypothetical protein
MKYYKQFVCDKCGRFFKRRIPGYNPITTTVASKLISSSSKLHNRKNDVDIIP